jgi:hypothetical protein
MRKILNEGELVVLDEKHPNSSIVEVVCQSPNNLFTIVKCNEDQWSVMTNRLSSIGNFIIV